MKIANENYRELFVLFIYAHLVAKRAGTVQNGHTGFRTVATL